MDKERQGSKIRLDLLKKYAKNFDDFFKNDPESIWVFWYNAHDTRSNSEFIEDLVFELQEHYSQHEDIDKSIYTTIVEFVCKENNDKLIYPSIKNGKTKVSSCLSTNISYLSGLYIYLRNHIANSPIMPSIRDSTAIFIDGDNIRDDKMEKEIFYKVDVFKLYEYLSKGKKIHVAEYFEHTREGAGRASWLRFLERKGIGTYSIPSSIDGMLATRMTQEIRDSPEIAEIILVCGDQGYQLALDDSKSRGIKITVVSSKAALSNDSRERADKLIYLDSLETKVARHDPNLRSIPSAVNY